MALRRRIAKRPWIPSFNVDPILRQGADSAVHELPLIFLLYYLQSFAFIGTLAAFSGSKRCKGVYVPDADGKEDAIGRNVPFLQQDAAPRKAVQKKRCAIARDVGIALKVANNRDARRQDFVGVGPLEVVLDFFQADVGACHGFCRTYVRNGSVAHRRRYRRLLAPESQDVYFSCLIVLGALRKDFSAAVSSCTRERYFTMLKAAFPQKMERKIKPHWNKVS